MKPILDMCCGLRMFWFDKGNPDVECVDIRQFYEELPTGHIIDVNPIVRYLVKNEARHSG